MFSAQISLRWVSLFFHLTLPNKFVTWVTLPALLCLTGWQDAGNLNCLTNSWQRVPSHISHVLTSHNVTTSFYSPRQTFYKKGINWLGHFGRHFVKEDFYYFFHLHWRHSWGAKRGNYQRGDALLWAWWWFVREDNSAGSTWSLHNRNRYYSFDVRPQLNSQ